MHQINRSRHLSVSFITTIGGRGCSHSLHLTNQDFESDDWIFKSLSGSCCFDKGMVAVGSVLGYLALSGVW